MEGIIIARGKKMKGLSKNCIQIKVNYRCSIFRKLLTRVTVDFGSLSISGKNKFVTYINYFIIRRNLQTLINI